LGDIEAFQRHQRSEETRLGALRAKKVVVTKAARMTGDIYYETLELQEGAEFEGGIHCTGDSASKPATKDAAAPQEL
jgi:cytoskeletal protein CcmA (bactofilin family)